MRLIYEIFNVSHKEIYMYLWNLLIHIISRALISIRSTSLRFISAINGGCLGFYLGGILFPQINAVGFYRNRYTFLSWLLSHVLTNFYDFCVVPHALSFFSTFARLKNIVVLNKKCGVLTKKKKKMRSPVGIPFFPGYYYMFS